MSEKHIAWEEWKPGDDVDEAHLAVCESCRREGELARFLHFQIEAAPRLEAPPFFAARVANLAASRVGNPFWALLERTARQLVPIFALLLMATSFLIYRSSQETEVRDDYAAILQEPAEPSTVTIDDMVVFLQPEEDGQK